MKPLVPGKPKAPNVKIINIIAYFGMILTKPLKFFISLVFILSYTTPTLKNNAADTKP